MAKLRNIIDEIMQDKLTKVLFLAEAGEGRSAPRLKTDKKAPSYADIKAKKAETPETPAAKTAREEREKRAAKKGTDDTMTSAKADLDAAMKSADTATVKSKKGKIKVPKDIFKKDDDDAPTTSSRRRRGDEDDLDDARMDESHIEELREAVKMLKSKRGGK